MTSSRHIVPVTTKELREKAALSILTEEINDPPVRCTSLSNSKKTKTKAKPFPNLFISDVHQNIPEVTKYVRPASKRDVMGYMQPKSRREVTGLLQKTSMQSVTIYGPRSPDVSTPKNKPQRSNFSLRNTPSNLSNNMAKARQTMGKESSLAKLLAANISTKVFGQNGNSDIPFRHSEMTDKRLKAMVSPIQTPANYLRKNSQQQELNRRSTISNCEVGLEFETRENRLTSLTPINIQNIYEPKTSVMTRDKSTINNKSPKTHRANQDKSRAFLQKLQLFVQNIKKVVRLPSNMSGKDIETARIVELESQVDQLRARLLIAGVRLLQKYEARHMLHIRRAFISKLRHKS